MKNTGFMANSSSAFFICSSQIVEAFSRMEEFKGLSVTDYHLEQRIAAKENSEATSMPTTRAI